MSRTRTTRRIVVPATIATGALALAGGAGIVWANAGSEDTLPDKSAKDLLAAIQNSDGQELSGTVNLNSSLDMASLESAGTGLPSLANGNHTLNVWSGGTDQQRVSLAGDEAVDVVRDGDSLYVWNSVTGEAVHETLPTDLPALPALPGLPVGGVPPMLEMTPEGIANQLVEAASQDPSSVTMKTVDTVKVAGHEAYGLVLSPVDDASLIDHMRLAVDAETGTPLATKVFTTASPDSAVVDARYSEAEFSTPEASDLQLDVPEGVSVQEAEGTLTSLLPTVDGLLDLGGDTLGVNALELTKEDLVSQLVAQGADPAAVEGLLADLKPVEGGRVLETSLFTLLVSDDGMVYYGTVSADSLTEAASTV